MSKVIVIGGGASGLVAAIFASKNNNDVVLLERNSKCGKKILMTGNGKCNYWNSDQNKAHYHSTTFNDFEQIMTKENENKVLDFFSSLGIIPLIKNGYYYPYSNQATSIQTALILEANLNNVKIINDIVVTNIIKKNDKFIVETNKNTFDADKIILATGSKASPKTGSDGNGYQLLEKLGHKIIKPLPALVQLKTDKQHKECSGVRTIANIKLYEDNNYIKEENGEIQFTDYGLSGICAMQLSGRISRGLDNDKKEKVIINFIPFMNNKNDFISWMDKRNDTVKNRTIKELLDGILNYKLVNLLVQKSKIKNEYWQKLSSEEKQSLATNLIGLELNVIGTKDFDSAQVTTGGVSLEEINPKTFESKIIDGLYIIGEVLDVDGDCGGYNLGFAWTSGMIVGENIND